LTSRDRPRGAISSRVRQVLMSSRVDLPRCQSFVAGGLSVRPCRGTRPSAWWPDCPLGDRGLSAWGSRTVRTAGVGRGPSEDQVRTVHMLACSFARSVAINGPSACG
jgi:hypothetical protein